MVEITVKGKSSCLNAVKSARKAGLIHDLNILGERVEQHVYLHVNGILAACLLA